MNRSFWIFMTMVTRPLCWAIAVAVYGAGIFLVFFASPDQPETMKAAVLTSIKPIRTLEQLDGAVKTPPMGDIEIVWGDLAHEFVPEIVPLGPNRTRHVTDEHHREIDARLAQLELPDDVVAIETRGWIVGQDVVDQLGKITSLERLGFLVTSNNDQPLDLTPLANLNQLRLLDLGIFSNDSVSLMPLAQLPKLETISIGSHHLITELRMAEIARMPALKTLFLPDVANNDRAMTALQALAGSDSLRRIHIAIPSTESESLAAIQSSMPNIKVGTSVYSQSRINALIAAVWATLILSGMGIHIGSQFSLPMAQLAPSYQPAHQRFTWTMIFACTTGITLVVCIYGANWLPVFALVGLCLVLGLGESIASLSSFGDRRYARRMGGLFTVIALGSLIILAFWNPLVIDAYLTGGSYVLPLLMLGVAALVVGNTTRVMNRLCRTRIESGRPLMLSMHDIQRASVEVQSQKLRTGASAAESASTEPFARQANMAGAFGWFALAIVVISMVQTVSLYGVDLTKYVVMISAGLAFWSLFVIGVKWWQRMPYLANLITRPPDRNTQIEQLFRNVRADVSKVWPVSIAVSLMISELAFFSPDNAVMRLIVSGLIVASIIAVCYAGIIWSLTIRSVWGLAILGFASYFAISVLIACIIAVGVVSTAATLPAYRFVILAVVLGGIAVAATILARRYYRKLEWGRFV